MESYIGKNGTFALMKNLNLEKVFRTVVLRAPISRAEISRVTGLNKVTVSNCVKTLMDCDLISEEGIVSSDSGRPPVMLMLSKTFGVLIGVEISADGSSMTTGELEMSNVDLSSEFTSMITTQRGFQANSRVITTSDTLLEELVNLKR